MVLTVSFVLLCPGSFATVASRISGASQPGWAVAPPQDLTPASGRQDHTTSPYASASFVSPPFDRSRAFRQPALHHVARLTLPRPPHPHPASVTIAIRPSGGVGCENSRCDLGCVETEISFGNSEIRLDSPFEKPARRANQQTGRPPHIRLAHPSRSFETTPTPRTLQACSKIAQHAFIPTTPRSASLLSNESKTNQIGWRV